MRKINRDDEDTTLQIHTNLYILKKEIEAKFGSASLFCKGTDHISKNFLLEFHFTENY